MTAAVDLHVGVASAAAVSAAKSMDRLMDPLILRPVDLSTFFDHDSLVPNGWLLLQMLFIAVLMERCSSSPILLGPYL